MAMGCARSCLECTGCFAAYLGHQYDPLYGPGGTYLRILNRPILANRVIWIGAVAIKSACCRLLHNVGASTAFPEAQQPEGEGNFIGPASQAEPVWLEHPGESWKQAYAHPLVQCYKEALYRMLPCCPAPPYGTTTPLENASTRRTSTERTHMHIHHDASRVPRNGRGLSYCTRPQNNSGGERMRSGIGYVGGGHINIRRLRYNVPPTRLYGTVQVVQILTRTPDGSQCGRMVPAPVQSVTPVHSVTHAWPEINIVQDHIEGEHTARILVVSHMDPLGQSVFCRHWTHRGCKDAGAQWALWRARVVIWGITQAWRECTIVRRAYQGEDGQRHEPDVGEDPSALEVVPGECASSASSWAGEGDTFSRCGQLPRAKADQPAYLLGSKARIDDHLRRGAPRFTFERPDNTIIRGIQKQSSSVSGTPAALVH
ncbi:hypothetical protein C8R44DRAFT_736088 [Mycena epipterygia]|nr:hypothetical protein C8R44DRAFT_736088 [Mycena epipterygia]